MCRHIYDLNIVNCDVKPLIQLNSMKQFTYASKNDKLVVFTVTSWTLGIPAVHVTPTKAKRDSRSDRWKTFKCIPMVRFASLAQNIVATFWGMHVSTAKYSYVWLPRKCDHQSVTTAQTDGRTDRRRTNWSLCATMLCRWHIKDRLWSEFSFLFLHHSLFRNWMLVLVLLCENERQRRDVSRYIKARRTKIKIQNL